MVVEFQQIQGISELEGCESSSLESPKDLMGNKKRKKSPLRKKKKKELTEFFKRIRNEWHGDLKR